MAMCLMSRPMKALSATFATLSEASRMMREDRESRMVQSVDVLVLAPVEADEAVVAVDVEALVGR
jgi:hypothetical protein